MNEQLLKKKKPEKKELQRRICINIDRLIQNVSSQPLLVCTSSFIRRHFRTTGNVINCTQK